MKSISGERKNSKLQATRRDKGVYEIPADDDDYAKMCSDARVEYPLPDSLAMPCIETGTCHT